MGELIVNGQKVSFSNGEMSLLWYLREELGLSGTKYGCGMGLCGACSVLLNGESTRSCILKLKDIDGMSVTTIEGIREDHPIIVAWQEIQVPQCGYCQSGQIVSAISLLDKNPNPTDEEIVEGMSGNICRCGTYMRIKKAIKQVASKGV